MPKRPKMLIIVAMGAALAGFLLGGAVGTQGLFSATTASWVQAIGSLTAIGAAWMIAAAQGREATRQLEAERERQVAQEIRSLASKRDSAIALILMVAERVRYMSECLADENLREMTIAILPGSIEVLEKALVGFPTHTICDRNGIIQFSHVLGILEVARASNKEFVDLYSSSDGGVGPEIVSGQVKILSQISNHLDEKAGILAARYGFAVDEEGGNSVEGD